MNYIEEHLVAKEKLLMQPGVHWFIMAPGLIMIFIGINYMPSRKLGALIDWVSYYGLRHMVKNMDLILEKNWLIFLCLLLILAGFGSLFRGIARRASIKMGITSERVLKTYGIFTTETEEIALRNMESIDIAQNMVGRIFNFGNVYFNSTIYGTIIFPMVKNPKNVRKTALTVMDEFSVFR